MIKLKIYSSSGVVITGLNNPNPVTVSSEINGLTDSIQDVEVMPSEYFAYNSTIEFDPKILTEELATRLSSLEIFGSIIRLDAKYPSQVTEVQKGFFVPVIDPKNNQAIIAFWNSKTPKKSN
jgi:hypothetical protein